MTSDPTVLPQAAKLKLARECAASLRPYSHNSALILDGERDGTDVVRSALAAIEATEARIVAWLRDGKGPYVEGYGEELADAIAANLHHEGGDVK